MDQEKNTFSFNNLNNSTTIGGVTFGGGLNQSAHPAAAANTNLPPASNNPFMASASSSPVGENGFSQAANSGNPNSNNQLTQQAIANAAELAAKQAKDAKNPEYQNLENFGPQTSLNVPVVSPTHFDFQTQEKSKPQPDSSRRTTTTS